MFYIIFYFLLFIQKYTPGSIVYFVLFTLSQLYLNNEAQLASKIKHNSRASPASKSFENYIKVISTEYQSSIRSIKDTAVFTLLCQITLKKYFLRKFCKSFLNLRTLQARFLQEIKNTELQPYCSSRNTHISLCMLSLHFFLYVILRKILGKSC